MKKLKISFILLIPVLLGAVILKNYAVKFFYPFEYEKEVFKYSREFDVPPELVFAVIKTESGFRPNVVSHKEAHGLMQITYDTFQWAKLKSKGEEEFDQIFDPDVNIKYGTFILSYLLNDFEDESVALAAYNAGRGNVRKWLADEEYSHDGNVLHYIPFKETREYVQKVQKSKEAYKKLYPDKLSMQKINL